MRLFLLGFACLLALATPVFAAPNPGFAWILAGPVMLKPDRGYLLFRVDETQSKLSPATPIFLRKPSEAEVAAYESAKKAAFDHDLPALTRRNAKAGINRPPTLADYPFTFWGHPNLIGAWYKIGIALAPKVYAYLFEVDPTDYIFYGAAISGNLDTCNCLGTVSFHVDAGVITDIGTVLVDDAEPKSAIPELATTTGMGKTFGNVAIASAIRPASLDTPVPAFLKNISRKPADFRAVAPFVETGAGTIARLAPIPGVLHYDNGHVFDEKSGHILP